MKPLAQVTSHQAATAPTEAARTAGDGNLLSSSRMPAAVADRGKILLGGGYRLPASRKQP